MNLIQRDEVYIGYSNNPEIRLKSTSGGVGSTLVKYLFDSKKIDYSLSFDYIESTHRYEPILINSWSKYKISGSIYQEIDMISFYKRHLNYELQGKRILLFTLPCQTGLVRALCNKYNIYLIVVGLTCSSQQSYEATKYLLKRINVEEREVKQIQYRGNGWPSGITIKLKDNTERFIPNNGSIWTTIFHSRLFIPSKCFRCQDTLNRNSDIVLADPWLPEYVETETIGKSLVKPYTDRGCYILQEVCTAGLLVVEKIQREKLEKSQKMTLIRKSEYKKHKWKRKILINLNKSVLYKRVVCSSKLLFSIHSKIKSKIESF